MLARVGEKIFHILNNRYWRHEVHAIQFGEEKLTKEMGYDFCGVTNAAVADKIGLGFILSHGVIILRNP